MTMWVGVTMMIMTETVMVIFQYDNVEGVTILLPADDQDISIQVLCSNDNMQIQWTEGRVVICFSPKPLMVTDKIY